MTHPKPSNSSFRYLIAGLKPLANVKVWGSVTIMALIAVVFWQYYHHPEWLGSDQLPTSTIDGEVEAEIGNSVDIGVTVQDLEQNRLNSQGFSQAPSQLKNSFVDQPFNPSQGKKRSSENNLNNSLLFPSGDGDNSEFNQPKSSIKFEPLMPNVKNLGSLFPPLAPSKNADKPIEIPDTLREKGQQTQNSALENALEDVFSQESPSLNPPNLSSQDNNRPSLNTNRSQQSDYPTLPTQGRNNPDYTQPYTQPNYPYSYTSPQPYSRPYGNGTAPAPVRVAPSSNQVPNAYGNSNLNPNYSTPANQNQPTYNYGMQPPQVNQYGGSGNY